MISNTDNTIERSKLLEAIAELAAGLKEHPDSDTAETVLQLTKLFEDAESATGSRGSHWQLVHAYHFECYAEDFAAGMGDVSGWPYDHIDWTKAADALKQDYKQVDFQGETYWVRA